MQMKETLFSVHRNTLLSTQKKETLFSLLSVQKETLCSMHKK